MNRGDVWWVEHPELGNRPVCVLTRQAAIPVRQRVTIAPATTTVRGIAAEVTLGAGDGLPVECVLSLDNVITVRKAHLTEYMTTLSEARMHEVCLALRDATGC